MAELELAVTLLPVPLKCKDYKCVSQALQNSLSRKGHAHRSLRVRAYLWGFNHSGYYRTVPEKGKLLRKHDTAWVGGTHRSSKTRTTVLYMERTLPFPDWP